MLPMGILWLFLAAEIMQMTFSEEYILSGDTDQHSEDYKVK